MDPRSQETLRKVEQNDDTLSLLRVGGGWNNGVMGGGWNNGDYKTRLGAAIGNNTHLTRLIIQLNENTLTVEDRGFYDGMKRNSSIREVDLIGHFDNNNIIIGGVFHEVLKVYQENCSHLTQICINNCNLVNGGADAIATTLSRCTNLNEIKLTCCDINDEQLMPIVEGIRGHRLLEELDLWSNRIENNGCQALATLLEDPNCNIRTLGLHENHIGIDGAVAIVNSLSNNSHLRYLCLRGNPAEDFPNLTDALELLLCNTSSISSTYASNHTLETIDTRYPTEKLRYFLDLNQGTNKSRVAMKKILKYHPYIDMEPHFDWDAEEGEQNLKALPYVVDWFDRARAAVADDDDESYTYNTEDSDDDESYNISIEEKNIEEKKLSAIFQFAKAMPLLFVPASHIKKGANNKKRKRGDNM